MSASQVVALCPQCRVIHTVPVPGPVMRFTLPVPPSANRWWRHVRTPKGMGRTLLSRDARRYLAAVRVQHEHYVAHDDVRVSLAWYRAAKRGDLDKRLPIALDVLQGMSYRSDGQVAELHAVRLDTDRQHPRLEVAVQRLGEPLTHVRLPGIANP